MTLVIKLKQEFKCFMIENVKITFNPNALNHFMRLTFIFIGFWKFSMKIITLKVKLIKSWFFCADTNNFFFAINFIQFWSISIYDQFVMS